MLSYILPGVVLSLTTSVLKMSVQVQRNKNHSIIYDDDDSDVRLLWDCVCHNTKCCSGTWLSVLDAEEIGYDDLVTPILSVRFMQFEAVEYR